MRSRMLSNRPRSAAFTGEPRAALPARLSLSMFSPSSFPAQRGILATKPGLSLRAAGGAGPAAVPATPRASAGRNRRYPPPPIHPSDPTSRAALPPPLPLHTAVRPRYALTVRFPGQLLHNFRLQLAVGFPHGDAERAQRGGMEGCGAGSGARRALHPGEERCAALFVAGLRGCGAAGPLCASARPLPPLSALPPRSLPALRGLGCGGGAGNARPDAAEAQWEGEGRERALVGRRWEGGCSSRAGGCGGREAAV